MIRISKSVFKPKAFEYLRLAEAGETIVITDRGKPVARITPYGVTENRAVGALAGSVLEYKDPTEPVGSNDWET